MAEYPPPNENNPIWNTSNFLYGASNLTIDTANNLYIKKTGGDFTIGPLTIKNQLYMSNGTVSLPSISFTNSTTSGLYLISSNSIGFATNGVNRLTIDNANITSTNPVRATIFQSTTLGGPTAIYSNSVNTQTGIYFPTSTTVGVVQNGIYTLTLATGQIIPFNPIRAQNGSSLQPQYSFSNSTDSGLFLLGANNVGMSIGTDTTQTWESKSTKFWGDTSGNNTGYTPSAFGHYEEYTQNITWNYGNATAITTSCKFTRIGRIVHFFTPDIIFTNAPTTNPTSITSNTGTIPSRFRPTTVIGFFAAWANNQAGAYDNMFCFVDSAGTFSIYRRTYTANNFQYWIYGFSGSWVI